MLSKKLEIRILDGDENIKRKAQETIICDICGFSYKKNNKSHHMKTKKHSESISIKKLN
jgi:hypothetical protein